MSRFFYVLAVAFVFMTCLSDLRRFDCRYSCPQLTGFRIEHDPQGCEAAGFFATEVFACYCEN